MVGIEVACDNGILGNGKVLKCALNCPSTFQVLLIIGIIDSESIVVWRRDLQSLEVRIIADIRV